MSKQIRVNNRFDDPLAWLRSIGFETKTAVLVRNEIVTALNLSRFGDKGYNREQVKSIQAIGVELPDATIKESEIRRRFEIMADFVELAKREHRLSKDRIIANLSPMLRSSLDGGSWRLKTEGPYSPEPNII